MKHYINLFILALIFIFPAKDIHASHAAGMDITYQCIGNSGAVYKII